MALPSKLYHQMAQTLKALGPCTARRNSRDLACSGGVVAREIPCILSQEGAWARSGAPGAATQCMRRRGQPLWRGRTPVRNGNFQRLLKPQKFAILNP